LLAKETPSPLLLDWAAPFFQGEEQFSKALAKKLAFENPYIDYLKRRKGLFDPQTTYAFWQKRLFHIFRPLLETWGEL
jgi:hypothetical protein